MPKLPKILLLGDSIRKSYQLSVAEKLAGVAEVVGPEDNCQFSTYTLSSLDRWIKALGVPDVVHWNNGIHDAGHNPGRIPIQIPLKTYRKNLESILTQLKEITQRIIWAASTPVHPDRPFRSDQWAWRNEEIDQYNAAAEELMNKHGVPINDLHSVVAEAPDVYLGEDQLHLSSEGIEKCAEAVAEAVKRYCL